MRIGAEVLSANWFRACLGLRLPSLPPKLAAWSASVELHCPWSAMFCSWSSARALCTAQGLDASRALRPPPRAYQRGKNKHSKLDAYFTNSNTSHEGRLPLYNCYKSCMPLPLSSGKRSSMSDWALSQKCLSADATTQNRRHSEQVTTAEHKNVTAWEVKSEANRYAGLLQPLKSFQLHQQPPLESKRKKVHVWLGTACRVRPALWLFKFSSNIKQPLWELQQRMEPNRARPDPPPHLTD